MEDEGGKPGVWKQLVTRLSKLRGSSQRGLGLLSRGYIDIGTDIDMDIGHHFEGA